MKRTRLSFRLICPVLLSLALVTCVQGEPEVVDGVAALVNKDVITFSQVRDLVGPRERSLRSTYSGQELVDKVREARKAALQDLIDRSLILQEFKKKEFAIPPSLVDDRITTIIREEFGGDRQAFIRTLQAQGYTMTKFRDAELDKIIVQAMRMQNVKPDTIVSPLKLDALYNFSKPEFTTDEQVHLWLISISKGANVGAHDTDPQKAVATEIRDKLSKGGKFAQLASLYSDDSSRQTGGDWGMVDRKTLNESLANVAFKLDVNKVSPVITLDNAYYILMVSEKKSAFTKPLPDVRDDLEKKLLSDERSRLQDQWLAGLRAKAFIKTF